MIGVDALRSVIVRAFFAVATGAELDAAPSCVATKELMTVA
jgi:hypothetical protein